ncbi:MAG: hypothetical protein Tsb0015_04630 [Simkaniaceae bacterium]
MTANLDIVSFSDIQARFNKKGFLSEINFFNKKDAQNINTGLSIIDIGLTFFSEFANIPDNWNEVLNLNKTHIKKTVDNLSPFNIADYISAAKTVRKVPRHIKKEAKKKEHTQDKIFAIFKKVFLKDLPSIVIDFCSATSSLAAVDERIPQQYYKKYLSKAITTAYGIKSATGLVEDATEFLEDSSVKFPEEKFQKLSNLFLKTIIDLSNLLIATLKTFSYVITKDEKNITFCSLILFEIVLAFSVIKNICQASIENSKQRRIQYFNLDIDSIKQHHLDLKV